MTGPVRGGAPTMQGFGRPTAPMAPAQRPPGAPPQASQYQQRPGAPPPAQGSPWGALAPQQQASQYAAAAPQAGGWSTPGGGQMGQLQGPGQANAFAQQSPQANPQQQMQQAQMQAFQQAAAQHAQQPQGQPQQGQQPGYSSAMNWLQQAQQGGQRPPAAQAMGMGAAQMGNQQHSNAMNWLQQASARR